MRLLLLPGLFICSFYWSAQALAAASPALTRATSSLSAYLSQNRIYIGEWEDEVSSRLSRFAQPLPHDDSVEFWNTLAQGRNTTSEVMFRDLLDNLALRGDDLSDLVEEHVKRLAHSKLNALISPTGSTLEFYRKTLACAPLTLTCLEAQGLLREIAPNVFTFGNQELTYPDEGTSAARAAAYLGLPIVLISDLPGLKGVPTVDAVVFATDGSPVANLSIKSSRGGSTNAMNSLKKLFSRARASHHHLYSFDYLPQIHGFSVTLEGHLIAKSGTPNQEYRRQLLTGALHLLGISHVKTRPVWLTVDLSDNPFKTFAMIQSTVANKHIPFAGTFLNILDKRHPAEVENPKVIHLESLVKRSGEENEISRYLMMIQGRVFDLDQSGFKITESCEALLSE